MQNSAKLYRSFLGQNKVVPREWNIVSKTNDDDSFPVLWQEMLCIDDFMKNPVSKLPLECSENDFEGPPAIVALKIFYILKHECRGALRQKYSCYIKEQSSLRLACKPMKAAERIFFRNTSDGKWLTWKAGEENVVVRNFFSRYLRDVAFDQMVIAEVCGIGLLRVFVPFGCKHAVSTNGLEALSKTSDPREQVDEIESTAGAQIHVFQFSKGLQEIADRAFWLYLS